MIWKKFWKTIVFIFSKDLWKEFFVPTWFRKSYDFAKIMIAWKPLVVTLSIFVWLCELSSSTLLQTLRRKCCPKPSISFSLFTAVVIFLLILAGAGVKAYSWWLINTDCLHFYTFSAIRPLYDATIRAPIKFWLQWERTIFDVRCNVIM